MASASDTGGVNGTTCNALQYQQFRSSKATTISCLSRGQTIGMTCIAGAACLSLVSVISVYIWMGWNVRWYRKNVPRHGWKLFQRPFDIYMVCRMVINLALLGFETVLAMGNIINTWWIHNGIVITGPHCTAQAVLIQVGALGTSMITLILAVHTFVSALWRVGLKARGLSVGLVGLVCTYCALSAGIGAGIHKDFAAPAPFWCYIGPRYPQERLAGTYIFIWLALFASVSFYIPLYFWKEGRLLVDENKWYKFEFHRHEPHNSRQAAEYAQRRAALGMLFYPLAYSVLVLPLSVVRWLAYDHKPVPSVATFFVMSMYSLSGAVNVLLLVIVRPYLLLLTRPECRVTRVNVRAGQPGLETEGIAGKSKDTKMLDSGNASVHSEMPLSPLTGRVIVLAPGTPSSLDSQCRETT